MKAFVTKQFLLIVLLLAVAFALAMKATVFQKETSPPTNAQSIDSLTIAFNRYWSPLQAEVNTYQLEQAQDGALHKGEAVLLFGLATFRTDIQLETKRTGPAIIPVLKTVLTKTFPTKRMTYSLLSTVFTPASTGQLTLFPNTLKVSTSSQTWDGTSNLQLAYRNNEYVLSGRSYGEKEANEDYILPRGLLEDELWNRIRCNPAKLPTGDIQLITGTLSAQLRHKPVERLPAKATLADYEGVLYPGTLLKSYTLEYYTDDRTLIIIFENQFPYKIVGWEETYDTKAALLTSRAVLKQSRTSNTERQHAPTDSPLSSTL